MATDDKDIVSAFRLALAEQVGRERFELWFGSAARIDYANGTLHLGAENRFALQWLRSAFQSQIETACASTFGHVPRIVFRVEDSTSTPVPTPRDAALCATTDTCPSTSPPLSLSTSLSSSITTPAATANFASPPNAPIAANIAVATNVAPRRDVEQAVGSGKPKAASSRRVPAGDLASYVVGKGNRLAFSAAEIVARQPGEISPLLIHGPTGVGKTHLLEGIARAVRRRHRGRVVISLSAEQFANGFLEALRGSGLPSFRRKYRSVDVLILDDLQFFTGKRHTQIELLYTVDTLLRDGRQLVLAGDRHPDRLADIGPELTARLAGGMVCRLEPPDHGTRLGVLGQMAQQMGLQLAPETAEYVATHFRQHARELSGALCRMKATPHAHDEPIDLVTAHHALTDMVAGASRVLRLADIEQAVCQAFQLQAESLQSGRKAKSVSHPRMLAMWLARKYTRAGLAEIGRHFGQRSHSTVASAKKRVDRWLADGDQIEVSDQTLNVTEAIRQVEASLRTA